MGNNNGLSAFPRPYSYAEDVDEVHVAQKGMSLRDYFAAKAMPMALEEYRMTIGRIGECLDLEWDKRNGLSSVAAKAYEMADAMLEARK